MREAVPKRVDAIGRMVNAADMRLALCYNEVGCYLETKCTGHLT